MYKAQIVCGWTLKISPHIIRKLRGLLQVMSIHSTNGNWDLIAEIHTSSLSEFDDILRKVRMIDGILNSETNLLFAAVWLVHN
tara:strand:+ start:76 stop:324 length:249 start_codon:yes stop_codon:yes gene_type:complete